MTDPFALAKPSILRGLLERHGFSFKKHLGQNFLIDENALKKIVDAACISDTDGVLEIGPGAGVVTRALSMYAKRVVAVEKDKSLRPVLSDSLSGCTNVELQFADILDESLESIWANSFHDCNQVSVVANLPYYVTTPILFHILESPVDVARIVVMVQKEVADRMVAKPGTKDYGVLSISVQYRANVSKVALVSRGAFMPAPNVDSTVVQLTSYGSEKPVMVHDEHCFFSIVKAAFGMRRKTLLNALCAGLSLNKEQCQAWLEELDIQPSRRGETLTVHEFSLLANSYSAKFD